MMTKVIFTLAASLLAGAALAQSGAQVHAATDAAKPVPPASASVSASAATDAARSGASAKASAATDAPRVIPQARKTKQPAAEAGKPVK
jgi:hypothetical protein